MPTFEKLNEIEWDRCILNGVSSFLSDIFGLLSSRNFATMATWHNNGDNSDCHHCYIRLPWWQNFWMTTNQKYWLSRAQELGTPPLTPPILSKQPYMLKLGFLRASGFFLYWVFGLLRLKEVKLLRLLLLYLISCWSVRWLT